MDLSHPATLLVPAGVAALVAWRLYSRVRRMIGRQRLSRVRPWLTVVLFPLLIGVFLLGSVGYPAAAGALVVGALLGCALGGYGLRLTKFEQTPLGLFYTPNAHLGIALALLLICRLLYRAVQFYLAPGSFQASSDALVCSPLTLMIFGTLAGYYVVYAIGLLRWRDRSNRAIPEPASEQRGA